MALARRSLGEGGKPPRLRRGAVETPPVQSVERALSVLEAVARSPEPVPLAHLTEVLGIDPSSAFRLANTLKRRGFLANPNGRKHYVLGPAVWRLSREYDWSRMLISICREPIKALAAATGETAHLAIRDARDVFFIDHHASGDQGVIVPGQTGKRLPLHCTAHGKALLADFGLAELKALYGTTPLERFHREDDRVARRSWPKRARGSGPTGMPSTPGSAWMMSGASRHRSGTGAARRSRRLAFPHPPRACPRDGDFAARSARLPRPPNTSTPLLGV